MTAHGTSTSFRNGCSCDACWQAVPHGTPSAYTYARCRCDACKAAIRDARAPRRPVPAGMVEFAPDTIARFWAKVNKTDTCWEWTGGTNGRKGYGVFYPPNLKVYAHRLSYVLANGPIAAGLVIDHLCLNVKCVNPDHLEPVTNRENLMRADIGPRNAAHNRARAAARRALLAEAG